MKHYHLAIALLAALILTGCTVAYAQGASVSKTIGPLNLDSDQRVAVSVTLRAGEVSAVAAASDLSATLVYDTPLSRPTCTLDADGDEAVLSITQSTSARRSALRGEKQQVNLTLPQHALEALQVSLDAGRATLDLRDASPATVLARVGLGALLLDLRGAHSGDMAVTVDVALGAATVLLPDDMNIRLVTRRPASEIDYIGISPEGRDVSPTAPTLTLTLSRGVGQVELQLVDQR